MNYDLSNLKILSGSALKVIAVISMTIDHVALYVLAGYLSMQELWLYDVLRGIGRQAFPIFAFLVIEGFYHTHNMLIIEIIFLKTNDDFTHICHCF